MIDVERVKPLKSTDETILTMFVSIGTWTGEVTNNDQRLGYIRQAKAMSYALHS